MNWMTIMWPMITSACLTLALINLRIAFGDVRRASHIAFFFSATAVAAISGLELAVLTTSDLETCQKLLRWSSLPVAMMVTSVAAFVWTFFGTGRTWLAVPALVLPIVVEVANFLAPTSVIRYPVALRSVDGFGGVRFFVPQFVEGPWSVVEMAAVLLVILFVLDASITLWRRGGKRRAVIVGGSIILFFLLSRGQAALVEKGTMQMPFLTSFAFLAVLIAMGHELSAEVFRAAKLTRDLWESERRMDLAAKAASLGFWTWDIVNDRIWATETALSLFEVPTTERINMNRFLDALNPEDRASVQQEIQASILRGTDYEKEYRVMLPDGRQRWIDARGRVEFDGRGKPVLMRGVLLDITSRRLSEHELQQVRAQLAHAGRVSMMGQLASALAHELNQPLGAILRNAEAAELFLTAEPPDLEEVRAIIADIRKDDQRAGEVIDRLRALLKRRDIESQTLNISDVINEVIALVRADATARQVKLEVLAPSESLLVKGDRVHLQQVLLNLIINGMDALSGIQQADRRVVLNASRLNNKLVEVSVADSGLGIAPGKLADVFEAFYTTKANGMGMGLPISRTIVEAHGGHLTAENQEKGGATFRFTLPSVGD